MYRLAHDILFRQFLDKLIVFRVVQDDLFKQYFEKGEWNSLYKHFSINKLDEFPCIFFFLLITPRY